MKIIRAFLAITLLWFTAAVPALAQQSSPNWSQGYVPTAAEWNFWFGKKSDWPGSASCLLTGCTFTGPVVTTAAATGGAGLNLPPGVAPTTPNNGDIWSTNVGFFVRVNGSTFQLASGGTSIPSGSTGQVVYYTASTTLGGNPNLNISGGALTAGLAGSVVGNFCLANATSGSVCLAPPTGALGTSTVTVPTGTYNLVGDSTAQTLSNKTIDTAASNAIKINGNTLAATAGTATVTVQNVTDTLVGRATTDTLSNKTINATTDILGGVTMTLGSDGIGDIYYRNSVGQLTRLGIGSATNVLTVSGGLLPSWQPGSAAASITIGTTAINSGTSGYVLYNNAGILGNEPIGNILTGTNGITLSGATSATIGNNAPSIQGHFKNLVIKTASTTTATVSADSVSVTDGTIWQNVAISCTINFATTGANALDTGTIAIDTWYFIWAIAQPGGTSGCLGSASSTAPTMPGGYTQKGRIGAIKTVHASASLHGVYQYGRQAHYILGLGGTTVLPLMASGTAGNVVTPTWAAITVNGGNVQQSFVPSTASFIEFLAMGLAGSSEWIFAPNSSYGPLGSTTIPTPFAMAVFSGNANPNLTDRMMLESSSIYWASNSTSANVFALGWEDNL